MPPQNRIQNKLLFVGGFPSGGTDLLKNVINAHPQIHISGEMPFLPDLVRHGYGPETVFRTTEEIRSLSCVLDRLDIYNAASNMAHDFQGNLASSDGIGLEAALHHMLADGSTLVHGSKTPQFTEALPVLLKLFPEARFIIVVRDVRDVCLSWDKKWGKDKFLCADKWARRMRACRSFVSENHINQVLFVRFEDLLDNVDRVSRQICEFLGLDHSPYMTEHHRYMDKIVEGKINYGKKIKRSNKIKWKYELDPSIIRRIEQIANQTMNEFGYELSHSPTGIKPISKRERLAGRTRDLYAMVFIGNRKMRLKTNMIMKPKNILIEIRKRWKNRVRNAQPASKQEAPSRQ